MDYNHNWILSRSDISYFRVLDFRNIYWKALSFFQRIRARGRRARSRRATRPGPSTLRGIPRMEGSFLEAPWMACLASPGFSGDVSVVLNITWVTSITMEVQGGD